MNKRSESGFALVVLAAMIIPMVAFTGLAIDTGVLYIVKGRLSSSVDAGALAGARALSRGSDDAAQRSRAQDVGAAYVRANFPNGYLMSRNLNVLTPTIDVSVANQRSVTITATVEAPTFFMKIFGQDLATVRVTATAVRRDVNIMLVMDRSRSMDVSGSCDDMRAAAIGFVTKFAPGRDNLGLVTFATSSFIEFPMGNNFATANPTLETIIERITCASGGTSTADGLSRGYYELARLNEPSSLNAIVFFTDGQPTAVHASFPITAGGPCPAAARPNLPGVWTVGGGASPPVWGLLNPSVGPSPVADDNRPAPNSTGCKFQQSWNENVNDTSDYTYIPNTDIWGNSLDTGYQGPIVRSNVAGGNRIRKDLGSNVPPASMNAAADAARRIRIGAVMSGRTLPNVVIFGIGLGDAAQPASHDFILRVTNDRRSPIYSSDQREGLYVFAPTAADLNDAFTRLASEILRIAQ
jgi:Mg-chelatase subunit ChlD